MIRAADVDDATCAFASDSHDMLPRCRQTMPCALIGCFFVRLPFLSRAAQRRAMSLPLFRLEYTSPRRPSMLPRRDVLVTPLPFRVLRHVSQCAISEDQSEECPSHLHVATVRYKYCSRLYARRLYVITPPARYWSYGAAARRRMLLRCRLACALRRARRLL